MAFGARLTATAPELAPLFAGDAREQASQFTNALALIIDYYRVGLEPEGFLAGLGQEHRSYGAQRAQFDAVGEALVFALATVLSDEFTPEVRAAWVHAYAEVSAALIRAGGEAASPQQPTVARV